MQIMWHEGNDALQGKLNYDDCIDDDAKHQMMPVLRVILLSKEIQRKSTVRIKDAVLCHRSSYESGNCTAPPPPSAPFSPPGLQSNDFGGGGFPGAMGGYVIYKSNSSSANAPAAHQTIRSNKTNKNNGGNNISQRKRKSPRNNNYDGQQAGKDDNDGDAKMGENLGINLIEFFLSWLDRSCKRPTMGRMG
jgi:hypothetical protein